MSILKWFSSVLRLRQHFILRAFIPNAPLDSKYIRRQLSQRLMLVRLQMTEVTERGFEFLMVELLLERSGGSALKYWLFRESCRTGLVQDFLAEQRETGATVHLTLNEFETSNLPFRMSVAPRRGKRRADEGIIVAQ